MNRLILSLTLIVLTSQVAIPQQSVRTLKTEDRTPLEYLLYMPLGEPKVEDGVPLVLFLHGGGEGGSDISKVRKHGLPKLIEQGKQFPFIVVSPQNPSETQFWDDRQLIRLLDELQTELPVDPTRIYLTGLSRGGYGAWRLAIQNPDRFAALIPISGGGPVPYARKLKDVPTWVFHGAKDSVIPLSESQRMVDALRKANGNVKFTIYPDAGHDAWTETYANPELYKWMLRQRRRPISEETSVDDQDRLPKKTKDTVFIRTDFPSGNGIVEKIEGDVVTLKLDLRGGRDWFYWSIECRTDSPRKLKFVLPDKKYFAYIGMQGPAISDDGGESWVWLGADSVDGSAFECAFEANKPLRLSVTIPYMQRNLDQLLREHKTTSTSPLPSWPEPAKDVRSSCFRLASQAMVEFLF